MNYHIKNFVFSTLLSFTNCSLAYSNHFTPLEEKDYPTTQIPVPFVQEIRLTAGKISSSLRAPIVEIGEKTMGIPFSFRPEGGTNYVIPTGFPLEAMGVFSGELTDPNKKFQPLNSTVINLETQEKIGSRTMTLAWSAGQISQALNEAQVETTKLAITAISRKNAHLMTAADNVINGGSKLRKINLTNTRQLVELLSYTLFPGIIEDHPTTGISFTVKIKDTPFSFPTQGKLRAKAHQKLTATELKRLFDFYEVGCVTQNQEKLLTLLPKKS